MEMLMTFESLVGLAIFVAFAGFIIWRHKKSKTSSDGTGTGTGGSPSKPNTHIDLK